MLINFSAKYDMYILKYKKINGKFIYIDTTIEEIIKDNSKNSLGNLLAEFLAAKLTVIINIGNFYNDIVIKNLDAPVSAVIKQEKLDLDKLKSFEKIDWPYIIEKKIYDCNDIKLDNCRFVDIIFPILGINNMTFPNINVNDKKAPQKLKQILVKILSNISRVFIECHERECV